LFPDAAALHKRVSPTPLIPAKVGIQSRRRESVKPWIPAFAGKSGENLITMIQL